MNNSSSVYLNVVAYRFEKTFPNIKPYPRFDLSSRPCHHRFTIDQFLRVKIRRGIDITTIGITFVLLHLVEIGLGRETY